MRRNEISDNKKRVLGVLALFSLFSLFWVGTLLLYLMFRMYFGKEPDFYHLGILAGMTGGLWGYGATKLAQIIKDMKEGNIFHTERSYKRARLIFIIILVICSIIDIFFNQIIIYFNLD